MQKCKNIKCKFFRLFLKFNTTFAIKIFLVNRSICPPGANPKKLPKDNEFRFRI